MLLLGGGFIAGIGWDQLGVEFDSRLREMREIRPEGNRPQAVRTYRDFRARLRAIIAVEPADELRALVAPCTADS